MVKKQKLDKKENIKVMSLRFPKITLFAHFEQILGDSNYSYPFHYGIIYFVCNVIIYFWEELLLI